MSRTPKLFGLVIHAEGNRLFLLLETTADGQPTELKGLPTYPAPTLKATQSIWPYKILTRPYHFLFFYLCIIVEFTERSY